MPEKVVQLSEDKLYMLFIVHTIKFRNGVSSAKCNIYFYERFNSLLQVVVNVCFCRLMCIGFSQEVCNNCGYFKSL